VKRKRVFAASLNNEWSRDLRTPSRWPMAACDMWITLVRGAIRRLFTTFRNYSFVRWSHEIASKLFNRKCKFV